MGPALHAMIERRLSGQDERQLARAFHESLAAAIVLMSERLCDAHQVDTIVLSGGTFQNALLLHHVRARLAPSLHLWSNRRVPPNDGGISLGQAALGAAEAGA